MTNEIVNTPGARMNVNELVWHRIDDVDVVPVPSSPDDILLIHCPTFSPSVPFIVFCANEEGDDWKPCDEVIPLDGNVFCDGHDFCLIRYTKP